MKTIYTLTAISLIIGGHAQNSPVEYGKNWQFGINYAVDIPNLKKMPFMNNAYGPQYSFMFKPVKKIPLWLTYNFGSGKYAEQSFDQPWTHPGSNYVITGHAVYQSYLTKSLIGIRLTRKDENARWQPHLDLGIGNVKFLSKVKVTGSVTENVTIPGDHAGDDAGSSYNDDDDRTETHTYNFTEKKDTYCCGTTVYTAGGGVQFRIADDISNRNGVNSYFDFSVNYLWGGNTCYTNDNTMKDYKPYSGDASRDPNVGYVNVSPESTAPKKMSKLYNSPVSMFNVTLGYVLRF